MLIMESPKNDDCNHGKGKQPVKESGGSTRSSTGGGNKNNRNEVMATTKRIISVVTPEEEGGPVEYKRQVRPTPPSRLRSLATQMSFRLDEGNGICKYRIGVEDNGCHSLLNYDTVSESARVLECIARSLNAVVIELQMIQNEIVLDSSGNPVLKNKQVDVSNDNDNDDDGNNDNDNSNDANHDNGVVVVNEPSLFGKSENSDYEVEDDFRIKHQLNKEPGIFTRAKITIQRVETHLLDPSPISLTELAKYGTDAHKDTDAENKNNGVSLSPIKNNDSASSPQKSTTNTIKLQQPISNKITGTDNDNNSDNMTISETLSSRNIRVAVVGNVDAGKSTLIGTLTTSYLDDGRGSSRTSIMKHRHEIESGRTSTSSTHLMGFKSNGQPITGRDRIKKNKRRSEDEIARESYKIITLMDLAGHEKYLKTTIHGVSCGFSDYALILVNSRHPPTHMTAHHLNLCCSFGIPVIVVFTKIDGCPDHAYATSKKEVTKLLRSPEVGKKPFMVRNEQDVATCIGKLHTLAPLFETSCVNGQGIELLNKMLFSLPKRRRHEKKRDRTFEFLVEDIFNVPGVGAVVSGFVNAGELTVGTNCHVYVGPTDDGTFMKTIAKSAHIARINTGHVTSGQSACLAFALNKDLRKKLRRGMVVLKENPSSTKEFDAEICVLKGEGTTIRRSYQAYVHILNVRQSAFARHIEIVNHNIAGLPPSHSACKDIDDKEGCGIVLRPGSRAKVRFEFAQRPEYIRPGMRMLFRDGRVRGVGIITAIPEVQVPN